MLPTGPELIDVFVSKVSQDAAHIKVLDLAPIKGGELPAFQAGAHIDVILGADIIRQYSILSAETCRDTYTIAVAKEPDGRGGSAYLHDQVEAGQRLKIGHPRNHFRLREDAAHSVLIAAGIGITPIWCMIQRLRGLGRSWELHYGAQSRARAALLAEVEALQLSQAGPVEIYFSREGGGRRMNLGRIKANAPAGSHFYACGPKAFLREFEEAGIDEAHRHVEHFEPAHEAARTGGFKVVLAKSNRSLWVPEGTTILEVLAANNFAASYSCREGICGQCEVKVLKGVPEHRDSVLTESEHASNRIMMICCSGAKSEELVLDL